MAFSKAPLKRFNDFNENDAPAPPPGAYDPVFATDVGNSAKVVIGRQPRSLSRPASSALRRLPSPSPSRGKVTPILVTPPQRERCRTPLLGIHIHPPTGPTAQDKLAAVELKYLEAEQKLHEIQKEHAEIQGLHAKLQEDKANWTKTTESCQVTIKELNATLEDMKAQLDRSHSDEDSTKEAFEKAEQEWKAKTATLQSSINQLQNSIGEHVLKHSELENLLKRAEKENQALEGDRVKMAKTLEEKQSALEASENKCQVLEESMGSCYTVYEEELNDIKEERKKWEEKEAELLESLRLSMGQIDSLKIAVQAEKSCRIHSEGKVADLLESLKKTEDNVIALKAEWEVKEESLRNEIKGLDTCLQSCVDNPATLLQEPTNEMVKELVEQRKTNADLKSKVDILERIDSIRKQGVEIDLASVLHSQGIEFSVKDPETVSDPENILDIASPLPNSTLYDTTASDDLKKKVELLKSQCAMSSKHVMKSGEELEETRNLLSQIEEDNQKIRQCIPIFTQDVENGNDKNEASSSQTSLDNNNALRTHPTSSDEKWVSGSNLALGPTPASTNLGPDKSSSDICEPSQRGSCGRMSSLHPIEEEEEDKHK